MLLERDEGRGGNFYLGFLLVETRIVLALPMNTVTQSEENVWLMPSGGLGMQGA